MPLKVMHLIGGGEIGGAEQHVLHLLKSLNSETYIASLGCLVPEAPLASLSRSRGWQTHLFPMHFSLDLSPLFQIVSVARRDDIDLLHCHGTRASLLGRLASKISGIPCISTIHSHPESDYPAVWKGKLALWLDNLTLPLASGLIAVSHSIAEQLAQRLDRKKLAIPLEMIYNGIAPLDFSSRAQLRSAFRQKWGIDESCQLIGTIGRLHPVKGHLDLIKATSKLLSDFPNVHLLIIGDGPLHGQLQEQLKVKCIPYTLPGYLPNAWRALPAMDLFVLPSLSEGMGLVLLEAAQAKVPIIASKVGGIPEIFRDEIEALLTNPSDPDDLSRALQKVLRDKSLTKHLISNAYQRAQNFTGNKMTENTVNFYHRILDQDVTAI